ncbi:MAG: sensor histidine kinase [Candidatus Sericytochromatia bacterium]
MNQFVAAADGANLREDLGMFVMLLQSTPDVVVFKDKSGRWLLANDAAIRLFDLEGVSYQGLTDLELGALKPDFASTFALCASTDEATWRNGQRCVHEEHIPQARGEAVILETIKTPLFEPGGDRHGLLLVGRDVTDRKQMEHEVIRRTVELEKAQELNRFKNDIVNAVSHDLRTPITSIIGYTELLQDVLAGYHDEKPQAYLEQIQCSTKRLSVLVDDLLDFARIEAGAFRLDQRDADLHAVIAEVMGGFFPQALDKRIEIRAELPESPLVGRFDPNRIGQVLSNLIGNAIKYTEPGGTVTVRATANGTKVHVEVEDTGIGISPDALPYVFEKFYQVDPSARPSVGGAGLGLSIAKALVDAHGGVIGARSSAGAGSTFWFTLPVG